MQYVNKAYYKGTYNGIILTEDNADRYLTIASRQVNTICRGRIEGMGFDSLSPFRKSSIQEVICRQAEFLYQNESMLETYLSSYAINGVSMQFGQAWNLHVEGGIAIPEELYQALLRTGLCYRGFGYYGQLAIFGFATVLQDSNSFDLDALCNYQGSAKRVRTDKETFVQLTGICLFNGDIAPSVLEIGTGEAIIFGEKRTIVSGKKARNPDGSVNYCEVDLG